MINFDWMEQALCTQTDPELWFAEGPANTVHGKRQKAKAICSWCPVKAECLEFAILTPYIHDGIWGGLEAHEVRRLARRREAS